MATIQLVAQLPSLSLDDTVTYNHSYILVTYDDGSQFYFRGGSSDGTGSGDLLGVYGDYLPGTVDWDAEGDDIASRVLVEGTDASIAPLVQTMIDTTNEINAEHDPYDAFVSGSNAFSGHLLVSIGIVDPNDSTKPDPTAVPIGPDGRTLFLTAFFNPIPYPPGFHYFDVMLDEYQAWVQYNNVPYEQEQMLTFAESWLAESAAKRIDHRALSFCDDASMATSPA